MPRLFFGILAVWIGTSCFGQTSDTHRAQIIADRDKLSGLLGRVLPKLKIIVANTEGFSTGWLRSQFGGALPLPPGYPANLQDELTQTMHAYDAMTTGKPITLEALRAYRESLAETEMLDATLIPVVLNQVGVANVSGEAVTARYHYTFDADYWVTGLNQPSVSAAAALARVMELNGRAAPEYLVEFQIGAVTLEGNVPKERVIAARQRVTDARLELEAVERAVTRQIERVGTLTAALTMEGNARAARYRERVAGLPLNSQEAANEKRYFEIEMRTLHTPLEAARRVLETTIKDDLTPAQERVLSAETALTKLRYDGMPQVLEIKTDHALLEFDAEQTTQLEQVEKALLALNHGGVTLAQARVAANAVLEDAVAKADAANDDLALSTAGSYVLQALAQGIVQITDIAVASEGNPHAFVAMSALQATNNIFLSQPMFYDAELDSDGNPTTEAQMLRRNLKKDVAASATNTLAKTGVGGLTKQISEWHDAARPSVREAIEHGSTRRALGRKLGQTLSKIGKRKSGNILTGIIEGIALDEVTEGAKQLIAREVTKDELRTYAAAQFEVAEIVQALKLINQIEDRDAVATQALQKRRKELLEERARLLPGLERLRPSMRYVRNDLFEISADQRVTVKLSNPDLAFDLLVAGVHAQAGTVPGKFTVGAAVMEELGKGVPMRLPLTIQLR